MTEKINAELIELQERMYSLEKNLKRLAIIMPPNFKYPYWHKLLCFGISEQEREKAEFACSIFTSRINQEVEFLNAKKNDTHEFSLDLFRIEPPTQNEVLGTINSIFDLGPEENCKELLVSMFQQGKFQQLISYIFPEDIHSLQGLNHT